MVFSSVAIVGFLVVKLQSRRIVAFIRAVACVVENLETRVMLSASPGSEVLVNTTTAGTQRTHTQGGRSLDTAADDSYVVVWSSSLGDGSGWGLIGQRFNADGSKAGPEFQVNTFTPGDQPYDNSWQLTRLADGRFLVVWGDYARLGDGDWGCVGQVFNADGSKAGGEFRLNTTTGGEQLYPAVSALTDGGFVAVYRGYYMNGGTSYDVFAQRFDAAGAPVGAEFRVSVADAASSPF